MMNNVNNLITDQIIDGLNIQHLIKTDRFEILSISLEKGSDFPEHVSPVQATLVVIQGLIDFKIEDRVFRLMPQQSISFHPNVKHSVRALENAKFLIVR
ncbi:cupin domain-containing protein [Fulvivirga sedimenti]|uniref:Cupin domain-containing protein n=1 Tax=Fulvivirga sedimenti TaxID=2879465 RepID=A0A9X1KW57_9BACT|nr:cupin domain-containing protein [Fulvivirga sedimenti]MCA6074390.1 cupin domain-containing protein [Fulvivirga sedimenti]